MASSGFTKAVGKLIVPDKLLARGVSPVESPCPDAFGPLWTE